VNVGGAGQALVGLVFLSLGGCAHAPRELSELELRSIARQPPGPEEFTKPDRIVGLYHGTPVHMYVACSDQCPEYSTRIVRYDVLPADCARIGGVVRTHPIPVQTVTLLLEVCLPPPLANEKPGGY
jgi:hypothetical protein